MIVQMVQELRVELELIRGGGFGLPRIKVCAGFDGR